jgi:hypothetical protein
VEREKYENQKERRGKEVKYQMRELESWECDRRRDSEEE